MENGDLLKSEKKGFHLSSLYSPVGWYSWTQAVEDFLHAKESEQLLKVWINTTLGETWVDKGEVPDWKQLFNRREFFQIGTVPRGEVVLTAGVDVQKDRLEVEVVAWGRSRESWSIDYQVFEGDTGGGEVWGKFSELLNHHFIGENGLEYMISMMAVDAGYATQEVYNWVRGHQGSGRVMAVKGVNKALVPLSSPSKVDITVGGQKLKRGIKLWPVEVSILKSELFQLLNILKEEEKVPANDVLHIYRPLRPGQVIGEPWLSSILLKLYELDQYDDAELVRKKTAAMFAGFITRLDPEANILGEGEANEQGVALSGLEPGTMQLLDPGEDIKFSEPSDVGGSYEAFMRQQLRAIAIGTGITYEQLTGDLTGVNYLSIRAGLIEFRRRCAMLQHNIIVFQFCRPVWSRWLELAVLCGELSIDEKVVKAAKEEVKWIPQGFDWVDPLKDQQAQQMAVRNGFKSLSEVVSEMGYDVEEIDQEIAEDQKRANSFGLCFDSDINHKREGR
ncbi:phage portal protein [Wolbachia endosymbiont of Anopheles demeilloni]|uniref:phage portal protein n=1 Tax=Wolbachia endosymbiont of Anopheles demeilloni TaxID=2748871 RepID=UPI001BDA3E81